MIEETITDKLFYFFTHMECDGSFSEYLDLFRAEMNNRFYNLFSSIVSSYDIPDSVIIDPVLGEKITFEDLLNQLPRFELNQNIPCFPTLIFNILLNYLIEYSHLLIPRIGYEEIVSNWKSIMEPDFQQIKFSIPKMMESKIEDHWKKPISKKIEGKGIEIKTADFISEILSLFEEQDINSFVSSFRKIAQFDLTYENIEEIGKCFLWKPGSKAISGHISSCASWSKEKICSLEKFVTKISHFLVEENNRPKFLAEPFSGDEKDILVGFKIYLSRRIQNATSRLMFNFNNHFHSSSIAKKQNLTLLVHNFFFRFFVPVYRNIVKKIYQVSNGTEYCPIFAPCFNYDIGSKLTRLFIYFVSFSSLNFFSSYPEFIFFPFSRNAKKKKNEFILRKNDQILDKLRFFFPSASSCDEIFFQLQEQSEDEIKGSGMNWNKILRCLIHNSHDFMNTEGYLHLPDSVQKGFVEIEKQNFEKELMMEEDIADPLFSHQQGKIILDLKLIQEKRRQEIISLILRMGMGKAILSFFDESEEECSDADQLQFLNSIPYQDLEYLVQLLRFEFLSYASVQNGNENPVLKLVFDRLPINSETFHLNMKKNLEIWCEEVVKLKNGIPMEESKHKEFMDLTKILIDSQIIDSHLLRSLDLSDFDI